MKLIGIIFLLVFLFPLKQITHVESVNGQTDLVYKPGEELKYEMSYGWITGGVASLSLEETKYLGKAAYHVKAIGKTVGVAHTIYNVKDIYESYFDPETGRPYKSVMNLKEGDYRNFNEVYFNHEEGTVVSNKSGKKEVGKEVFDIVSAFYYLRKGLNDLKPGDRVVIHTYFHDEPWDLVIRYKGTETIKTSLGKISCLKFKPLVMKGTFENEDALDIWISNDKNKIPIRVKMKFFIGSFKTDLVKYTGLTNELEFVK